MLRYDVVDVFTDRPFAGNQLAVVHDASGLADAQLQALANEFNFSETTFPSQVTSSSYLLRIFTPGGEIPFAGHPTLGAAWVLSRGSALTEPTVTQHCAAGDFTVTVSPDGAELTAVPRDLAQCPVDLSEAVLADLGLGLDDLAGTAYFAGTGLTFLHLPVVDDAVSRARATSQPLDSYGVGRLGLADPLGGVNLYAVDGGQVHARVFVPELSIPEDAATGSAAAGLGQALVATGVLPDGGAYRISQGFEMGRPSVLYGTVVVTGGRITSVRVRGQIQAIASGTIAVPPG